MELSDDSDSPSEGERERDNMDTEDNRDDVT